ncbi:MAG: chorismate mutase [Chloroflexi bacterium]|nr:chorismate mutase [Chloroflexota bacterium]
MQCRGIRGATTVAENSREQILAATRELLTQLVEANGLRLEDIACAFFSTTRDLNADFPAVAAREMGWKTVPLMCGHEMDVPGALSKCLRVMLMCNTSKSADEIVHVYTRGAKDLRTRGALVHPSPDGPGNGGR